MRRDTGWRPRPYYTLVCGLFVACFCTGGVVHAGAAFGDTPAAPPQNFLYFLFGGGGVIGIACTVPILCMSVAAIAIMIEQLITLRRAVLLPRGLVEEVREHISNEAFSRAEQQCKLRTSLLADVILAGLRHVRFGFSAVEKAMEDALQAQSARLMRKVEFLSVIANLSTMLGLFGTVVGLVLAFKKVADTQGVARASDLAGGIYLALMTTIEGLAIAIPTVGAYAFLKHRADTLIADAAGLAERAFAGYNRERMSRRASTASS